VAAAGSGSTPPIGWKEVLFDAPLDQGGHLQGSLLYSDTGLRLSPLKVGKIFTLALPDLSFRGPATVLSIKPAKRRGEHEAEVLHVVRFRDDDDLGTVLLGDWEPPREFVERWRSRRREVALRLEHPVGGRCDAQLLRTVEWIAASGACVGGTIFLDLPEMGARGWAKVVAIRPCGMIEVGRGGMVTGRFRHSHGHPGELVLESGREPIGVTSRHLFWSVDRQEWVPVGELRRGERLETLEGVTRVVSYTMSDRIEPVYNLEVEGDHCYRVGEQGLLVHNVSCSDPCSMKKLKPGKAKWERKKIASMALDRRDYKDSNSTICVKGTKKITTEIVHEAWALFQDPVGTLGFGSDTDVDARRWSRCVVGIDGDDAGHVIANKLGGSGHLIDQNLFPQNLSINRGRYRAREGRVRQAITTGGRVCVHITYDYKPTSVNPNRPSSVTYDVYLNFMLNPTMPVDFSNPVLPN
jgi:hypothetical protein